MASNAPNYEINYNDKRFTQVEADKQAAMSENEKIYGGMINSADKFYNAQIDAAEKWGDTQAGLQQEQTDFAIEKIEQQKAQAKKDYTKEQQGAWVDYQKESSKHGVGAEQRAAQGLEHTGYSESAKVSQYNTWQNRVATARDVFMRANLNYDNMIKEAQLQNNAALAEIAFNTLQTTLELGLEGFKYKNDLIIQQADKKLAIDEMYYGRWQDVYNQMFEENKFAEEVRQYNQNYQLETERFDFEKDSWEKEFDEKQRQFDESLAEDKRQHNESLAEDQRQHNESLAEDQRQYNTTRSDKNSSSSGSSGGGNIVKDGSGGGGFTSSYAVNTPYYQGDLNKDAFEFGVFSNGYQPKGISGHGKVSKTGDTFVMETEYSNGQKVKVEQNIWKTSNGKLWYWDGRENKYKPFKA